MNSGEPPDEKTTSGIDDGGTDGKNDPTLEDGETPDQEVTVAFKADRSLRDAAKEELDFGGMSEILRDTLRKAAFGEEVSERERAQKRLDSKRDKLDEKRKARRQLDAEIESIETEVARLEERSQRLESRDEQFEAKLEMLDEVLQDGRHVFPTHGQVIQAARTGDAEPEDVVEMLRQRNPNRPEDQFYPANQSPGNQSSKK